MLPLRVLCTLWPVCASSPEKIQALTQSALLLSSVPGLFSRLLAYTGQSVHSSQGEGT